jgi:parallel beta-helix repeat protein
MTRHALVATLLVLLAVLPTPAIAQVGDIGLAEVDALEEGISSNLVAGDTETDPVSRTLSYRAGLEAYDALAARAKTNSGSQVDEVQQAAGAAIARFRASAVTGDVIALHLLEAELARRAVARDRAFDPATDLVEIGELVGRLEDPVQRAGAALTVARFLIARNARDSARRYIQTLSAGMDRAPDREARAALGRGALWLAAATGSDSLSLITKGAASLPSSAARAAALQDTARVLIARAPASAGASSLGEVGARLSRNDVYGALWLALAVPITQPDWRDKSLALVLNDAKRRGDYGLGVLAALGFADTEAHQHHLVDLVETAAWNGRGAIAAELARLIPQASKQAAALASAGDRLVRAGYFSAAREIFLEAHQVFRAAEAGTEFRLLARIASGLAEAGEAETALRLVQGSSDESLVGPVRAAIAVARGRAGDVEGAQQWIAQVVHAEERDAARIKIATARLETGDLNGALTVGTAVENVHAGAPIARELILALRRAKRFKEAQALLQRLPAGLERLALSAALTMRSDEAAEGDGPYARFRRAHHEVTSPEQESAVRIMAPVLAGFGRGAEARELAASIPNAGRRTRIEADILLAEAEKGPLKPSLDRLRELTDWRVRVDAFRQIAVAKALQLDSYGVVGAALGRSSDRTPGKAAIEPVQVNELDRSEGLVLGESMTEISAGSLPSLPELGLRAANVRAVTPVTKGGEGGLALARLSRFHVKFFHESLNTSAGAFLYQSQGSINPYFIDIASGVLGVSDLRRLLGADADRFLPFENGVLTIRLPIVIGPKATLVLSGEEVSEVRLSATAGAYLVNVGKLYVVDTELVAFDEKAGRPAYTTYENKSQFRPFVTMWSDSESYFAASRIVALGYSSGKAYGLSFSAGPKNDVEIRDDEQAPAGIMVENSIENLLYGFYSYEAEHVRLVGNEYRDNIVYAIDPHDRSKHLLIGLNTTYGSKKKHGIIISREVDESWIVGNLAFNNVGSGIMLDRRSVGTLVYANSSLYNDQDGITLFESGCSLILSNDFSENRRSGIKVRNSADVAIFDNMVARNQGSGIEGYIVGLESSKGSDLRDFELDPYTPVTTLAVARNVLNANGTGIAARGASGVAIGENTFRRQSPQLFTGDLKSLSVKILGTARSGKTAYVTSTCLPRQLEYACPFFASGTIPRGIFEPLTAAGGDPAFCSRRADTVQGQAFETKGEARDEPSN